MLLLLFLRARQDPTPQLFTLIWERYGTTGELQNYPTLWSCTETHKVPRPQHLLEESDINSTLHLHSSAVVLARWDLLLCWCNTLIQTEISWQLLHSCYWEFVHVLMISGRSSQIFPFKLFVKLAVTLQKYTTALCSVLKIDIFYPSSLTHYIVILCQTFWVGPRGPPFPDVCWAASAWTWPSFWMWSSGVLLSCMLLSTNTPRINIILTLVQIRIIILGW